MTHPGRPDRPEGPPPNITREDVEFCGHGNRADGGPCCVPEATKTTTILDVDRQYREFREERVDIVRPLTPADQALENLANEMADDNQFLADSLKPYAQQIMSGAHALETLALMAEHELSLDRGPDGTGWRAMKVAEPDFTMVGCSCGRFYVGQREEQEVSHWADGATIGDAVRACVQRLKEKA